MQRGMAIIGGRPHQWEGNHGLANVGGLCVWRDKAGGGGYRKNSQVWQSPTETSQPVEVTMAMTILKKGRSGLSRKAQPAAARRCDPTASC